MFLRTLDPEVWFSLINENISIPGSEMMPESAGKGRTQAYPNTEVLLCLEHNVIGGVFLLRNLSLHLAHTNLILQPTQSKLTK